MVQNTVGTVTAKYCCRRAVERLKLEKKRTRNNIYLLQVQCIIYRYRAAVSPYDDVEPYNNRALQ